MKQDEKHNDCGDPGCVHDHHHPQEAVRNPQRDVGRNDPCPCGSGEKFKKCCLKGKKQ